MGPSVVRIILYVRDVQAVAAFYERHFGMKPQGPKADDWLELSSAGGGTTLALHRAAKTQRSGAAVKIVFGVRDISAFKAQSEENGLIFGPIHRVGGFEFANAKDPAGNSISISSRGLA